MDEAARKDDALFDALSKNKKRKRRRRILTIVIVLAVLVAAAIAGIFFLRRRVTQQFASGIGDVTSAQATVGSISTQVSGSGTLVNVDEETLTVPANVQIKEILVSANDTFTEGDVLVKVDAASVMKAMSTLQDEIDDLDGEIASASTDKVSSYINAGVAGRVKILYAGAGDTVAQCMYDHGALAVLSLDGYMSAEIASDALSAGDKVRVIRADGSEIPGAVDSAANGKAVILVTDNGPAAGETVEILNAEGTSLGSAELAIHSPLRVSGITGTVSAVRVQENQKVYASTTIFNLTDTAYAAAYQTLLEERSALEDTMVELMTLYSTGVVRAPYDGSVTAVLYDSAEEYEDEISLLTVSPDRQMNVTINVDESNILSLELGQTAQITVSSIGDTVFSGTVTEINKTASSASGVTRYSAVVTLDKTPEMLQGMSARVVVRISGVDNAVIIPVEALHQTSSTSYVYTSFDEETQEFGGMVNVEVGITNSSYAEILSGLQEGDTVWYTETENSFFSNMGFAGGSFPGGSGSGSMPSMPSGGDFSGGFPGGSGSGGSGGFPGGGSGGFPGGGSGSFPGRN